MSFNIAVLYGSVREGRIGIKAAYFIKKQLESRGHSVSLLDAKELDLPLMNKMYKQYEEAPANLEKVASALRDADGFVLVTGEYNHSLPPALKNMLDFFQQEYHWKPSAVVSYSVGGFGGVRAAVHARVVLGELGTVSIPSMMPVPKVGEQFDDDGVPVDKESWDRRSKKFLDEFEWYLEALQSKRKSGTPY